MCTAEKSNLVFSQGQASGKFSDKNNKLLGETGDLEILATTSAHVLSRKLLMAFRDCSELGVVDFFLPQTHVHRDGASLFDSVSTFPNNPLTSTAL